jgi:hypothetical protein
MIISSHYSCMSSIIISNSHLFLVSHSGKEGAGAGAGCGVVSSDEVHSPLYKFLYKRPFRVFMSENWWLIEPEPFGPCVDIVDIVTPHPWAPAGFNVMTWNRSPEKVLDGLSVVLRAVTDFDHARDMFAVHRDLSVCMDIRIRTSVTVAAPSCRQEGVVRVPNENDVFFWPRQVSGVHDMPPVLESEVDYDFVPNTRPICPRFVMVHTPGTYVVCRVVDGLCTPPFAHGQVMDLLCLAELQDSSDVRRGNNRDAFFSFGRQPAHGLHIDEEVSRFVLRRLERTGICARVPSSVRVTVTGTALLTFLFGNSPHHLYAGAFASIGYANCGFPYMRLN